MRISPHNRFRYDKGLLAIVGMAESLSVIHLKGWAVLGPRFAVIVDAGGGDVDVAEPLLHLGDVGPVIEGVGGGCDGERMRTDFKASL